MAKRDFAKIEELLVELFWTVQVYRKKLTKTHDYSRFFLKNSILQLFLEAKKLPHIRSVTEMTGEDV